MYDYKKTFDSVPYDWIIKELQLAKVPEKNHKCYLTTNKSMGNKDNIKRRKRNY